MNREEPYRNQAERLKQRIEKINGGIEEREAEKEVLPPREHIHRKKKTKTKWKLKYPVIRLLVLFFILLPVISFSVISYLDDKKVNRAEKTNADPIGYETINLDSKDSEDKTGTTQSVESDNDSTSDTVITDSTDNMEEVDKKEDSEKSNAAVETANSTDNQESDKNTAQTEQKTNQPEQKKTTSTTSNTTKFTYYTVKKGDTLFHISDVYFHSPRGMVIIMQANHMTSDQVQVGQVLKIPTSN